MNERIVLYGGRETAVTDAGGVEGMLLRSMDGSYFFRIYHADKTFADYRLRHNDLSITIEEDELASFYLLEDENILDHSPEVLGLEIIK